MNYSRSASPRQNEDSTVGGFFHAPVIFSGFIKLGTVFLVLFLNFFYQKNKQMKKRLLAGALLMCMMYLSSCYVEVRDGHRYHHMWWHRHHHHMDHH